MANGTARPEHQGPAQTGRRRGGTREAVARIAGVIAAGSVTYQSIEAVHHDRKMRIYVVGYEPGRLGGPSHLIAGRMIARSHFEAIADRRSGLQVGDRLPLGQDTFTIVGLTDNQIASGGDPVVYIVNRPRSLTPFGFQP